MPLTRIQTDAIKDAITSSNIADGTIQTVDVSSSAYGLVQNSFRNKIINGDMRIDQRKSGSSATASDDVSVATDMWSSMNVGTGFLTMQRVADAPAGFVYSTKWTMPSSVPSLGTNDGYAASIKLEASSLADLKYGTASARSMVLSFWVKSSVAGTFPVSVGNYDSAGAVFNAAYDSTYTISQANTWEYKTVVIAPQTSFSSNNSTGANTLGLGIYWGFGAGSLRTSQATGSWYSQTRRIGIITGNTSLINTANATFQLTGVQFESGTVATPFEYRPYGTELALCQRYFQTIGTQLSSGGNAPMSLVGFWYNATQLFAPVRLIVPMRAGPTLGYSALTDVTLYQGTTAVNPTAISFANSYPLVVDMRLTVASGGTSGQASCLQVSGTLGNGIFFVSEL
jgi:hypothetical protein